MDKRAQVGVAAHERSLREIVGVLVESLFTKCEEGILKEIRIMPRF
jgi:hypothetical protein